MYVLVLYLVLYWYICNLLNFVIPINFCLLQPPLLCLNLFFLSPHFALFPLTLEPDFLPVRGFLPMNKYRALTPVIHAA